MALGASRGQVMIQVVRHSLMLTVPGLLAGVVIELIVLRSFSGMLVGVSASDPLTLLGAALVLMTVILAASYLPASRATRIEPMVALRCQ